MRTSVLTSQNINGEDSDNAGAYADTDPIDDTSYFAKIPFKILVATILKHTAYANNNSVNFSCTVQGILERAGLRPKTNIIKSFSLAFQKMYFLAIQNFYLLNYLTHDVYISHDTHLH